MLKADEARSARSPRGYFGVAVYDPKNALNHGELLRSAHVFGAHWFAIIGARWHKWPTNVTKAERHLPLLEFEFLEDFVEGVPFECKVVGVDVGGEASLQEYEHPDKACYLFGGEDVTLPRAAVRIETPKALCLNLVAAGAVVMYDRIAKQSRRFIDGNAS